MPTTPDHGLPYPALSEAPNGPEQIGALALAVDAALTGVAAPVVTTLTVPAAGDPLELVLVDSLTAPTYAWLMRYVAGISDAYKWLCLGGVPALRRVETAQSVSAGPGNWGDAATVGPDFTVPRAGIYRIAFGAHSSGNRYTAMSVALGAAAATDADSVLESGTEAAGAAENHVFANELEKTLAAAALIRAKYQSGEAGVAVTFSKRWLRVLPLRLS